MNIGIIGCGNISTAYLQLAPQFRHLDFTACSDLNMEAATLLANEFGIRALSVEEMLADPEIELIVNLTVPAAHFDVSTRILNAGKHVYSEKPFVLSYADGMSLLSLAESKGKRIGSAPDTFLGGAHQSARAVIDSGRVGNIIGGSCHFMNHGLESWHPNPDFFYQQGGGPMLDMGAYYLSNLVQLVGPVKSVMAMSSAPFSSRTISSEPRAGQSIPVEVDTSVHSLLEFCNGALITMSLSWDVWQHDHNRMELYGSEATLHVPDPNFFGGELKISKDDDCESIDSDHPFEAANFTDSNDNHVANYRGAGLADMIEAIVNNKPHRCSERLALHVIDVMTSALHSSESRECVDIQSTCDRPQALGADQAAALLKVNKKVEQI